MHLTTKSTKERQHKVHKEGPAFVSFVPTFVNFVVNNAMLVFLFTLASSLTASGQDSLVTLHSDLVTIKEDSKIADLMNEYKDYNQRKEFTDGYRIQIMYTDVRDEVYKSKSKTYGEFPDLPSYVEYEQPYYKLRIGDFSTRLEATYYLQKVTPIYSGAFIVKDKIRVK